MTFYDENAKQYFDLTAHLKMDFSYERFLSYVSKGGHILDLGCGSGRDSKYFKEKGYQVSLLEKSKALAALASEYVGEKVLTQSYHDLDIDSRFDAVWACASLLHCPKSEINDVFTRIHRSLKPGGVFYMAFKNGTNEYVDGNGRLFNNYTISTLRHVLDLFPGFRALEWWLEDKPSTSGATQTWVNFIVQKNP